MGPLRDILIATIILSLLPVSFWRPWIGILVWTWLGLMNPHRLGWTVVAWAIPWAQMVGIAVLAGFFFSRDRGFPPLMRETFLLFCFWVICFLSTVFFSLYPDQAWGYFMRVSKIFLMIFVTLALIYNQKRLKALIWVTALSIGFYGFKGGIWAILTGGQHQVIGPYRSFIEGNTELGLAMVMVLPLFLLLAREATYVWLKYFLYSMFGLSVIAILVTYSRGAFLGLGVVLTILFLKSRGKVIALVLVILATPLVLDFLPEQWFGRMSTIQNYEKDASANARLVAWEVALKIALDHPILGAGFLPFTEDNFRFYVPWYGGIAHDAHNIFLQVLAEHGFIGLGFYVALWVSTILSLRKIVRIGMGDPAKQWMVSYSQMIQAGLFGFVVSGFFLSLSYFDLYYVFVALTIILKKLSDSYEPQEGVVELSEPTFPLPVKERAQHVVGMKLPEMRG